MNSISAGQMRMARALLEWSQDDLAVKTRLSISTIRKLELGYAPRPSTAREIRNVIEESGLELTDGDGVRRRFDITHYRGEESCDKFFDDILQTVKQKGGEIIGFIKSQAMFLQSLGIHNNNLYRLEQLHKVTNVRCILLETLLPVADLPDFQFHLLAKADASPSYFYVYGNQAGDGFTQ